MDLKVCDVGEKELVKYIIANCDDITPDDTAITDLDSSNKLISTCDMLIQSKHFPKKMTFFQMGFKAVTVNVSDLAAMGAKPLGFLLAIGLPKTLKVNEFKEIIKGVMEACSFYEIPLIGGDTNEASEIIISGTALGVVKNPIMKNTSKAGDLIAITSNIGLAALGFELSDNSIYVEHSLKPIARIKEGKILKENGATAATDITDGLASELYEMKRPEIGIKIYEDKLNISEEYKRICCDLGIDYLDLMLHVGEDFELVFTFPQNKKDLLESKLNFIVIGEINTSGKIEIVLENGSTVEINPKGYNHFK